MTEYYPKPENYFEALENSANYHLYRYLENYNFFIFKLHALSNISKGVKRKRTFPSLDASLEEHFNYAASQLIRSCRDSTNLVETGKAINFFSDVRVDVKNDETKICSSQRSGDWIEISLETLKQGTSKKTQTSEHACKAPSCYLCIRSWKQLIFHSHGLSSPIQCNVSTLKSEKIQKFVQYKPKLL